MENKNAEQKKQIQKQEYRELEKSLKHILDPEAHDRIKLELQYLDEMIKGKILDITKMN